MPAPRNALSRGLAPYADFIGGSGGLDYDPSWGEVARRLPAAFERKARGAAQALPNAILDMLTAGPFRRLNDQLAAADATGTPRADAMDYGDLLGTMVPAAGAGLGATAVGAVPRNALGSFGGKIGSTGLDMSQDARMARAKGLGFDTDRVLYRGADQAYATARASERGALGPGVYFTDVPSVARRYGNIVGDFHVRGTILNTKPFRPIPDGLADSVKAQLAPDEKARWDRLWPKRREENGIVYGENVDAETFREVLTRSVSPQRVPEILQRLGIDGMEGIADGHELVVFDPRNVRSVNAAFDPARTDSADVLAARIPFVPPRQDDEKRKR